MRKFYKFTKNTAEDRRQELLDFINKYNSTYRSYNNVIDWLKGVESYYILTSDGFEFMDEETSNEPYEWGHGALTGYLPNRHIVVNTDITLGKL